jgi:tetratricopeptide (TPR) repeat protein
MKRTAVMGMVVWASAVILSGCGGPSTDQLVTQGVSQYELGHLEQAKDTLSRVVRADPANPKAHFYMGRVCYSQKFYEMAVYHFQCTLDADPGYPEIHKWLRDAQRAAGAAGTGLRFLPETRGQ